MSINSKSDDSVVFFPTFATRFNPRPSQSQDANLSLSTFPTNQNLVPAAALTSLSNTLFTRPVQRVVKLFKFPTASTLHESANENAAAVQLSEAESDEELESSEYWEIQVGGFISTAVKEDDKKKPFWDLDNFPQLVNVISKTVKMSEEQRQRAGLVSRLLLASGAHGQKVHIRFQSPAKIVGFVGTEEAGSDSNTLAAPPASSPSGSPSNADIRKYTLSSMATSGSLLPTSTKTDEHGAIKVKTNAAGYFETPRFVVQVKDDNSFKPVGPLQISFEAEIKMKDGSKKVFEGIAHSVDDGGFGIICDVEDTIKIANVTSADAAIRNFLCDPPVAVPGMSLFINNLIRKLSGRISRSVEPKGKVHNIDKLPSKNTLANPPYIPPPASIHYVSSAPVNVLPDLLSFTESNQFPRGSSWHLKKFSVFDGSIFDYFFGAPTQFKIDSICSILDRFETKYFVLVGDSAQGDPEIYAGLAKKYGFVWPIDEAEDETEALKPGKILHICIRLVQGVGEKLDKQLNSKERFQSAFSGLPDGLWSTFSDPGTMSQNLENNVFPLILPYLARQMK